MLDDDALALKPWMMKPYSRGQLIWEERMTSYRTSRVGRVVENALEILVSRFGVLLGTMSQNAKVIRDIVLTCVVLHNMPRTHQGADKASTPENNVAACISAVVSPTQTL